MKNALRDLLAAEMSAEERAKWEVRMDLEAAAEIAAEEAEDAATKARSQRFAKAAAARRVAWDQAEAARAARFWRLRLLIRIVLGPWPLVALICSLLGYLIWGYFWPEIPLTIVTINIAVTLYRAVRAALIPRWRDAPYFGL